MSLNRIDIQLDEEAVRDLEVIRKTLGGVSVTEAIQYALEQTAGNIRCLEQAQTDCH